MNFEKMTETIVPGLLLSKPYSYCIIKGTGRRRGEDAVVYRIPSKNANKLQEKGVTESEFNTAVNHLQSVGSFTRDYFKKHLRECNTEGSCTFTTIGSIFEKLGIAKYMGRKIGYIRIDHE